MAITPILPILSTTVNYVSDRSQVAAALVQYLLLSPGRTSDTHEELLISFRKLAGYYGHDRALICNALNNSVPSVLSRYYPDDIIDCTFEAFDYNPEDAFDPRFGVTFNILFRKPDGTTEPAVLTGSFTVNDDSSIDIIFN